MLDALAPSALWYLRYSVLAISWPIAQRSAGVCELILATLPSQKTSLPVEAFSLKGFVTTDACLERCVSYLFTKFNSHVLIVLILNFGQKVVAHPSYAIGQMETWSLDSWQFQWWFHLSSSKVCFGPWSFLHPPLGNKKTTSYHINIETLASSHNSCSCSGGCNSSRPRG